MGDSGWLKSGMPFILQLPTWPPQQCILEGYAVDFRQLPEAISLLLLIRTNTTFAGISAIASTVLPRKHSSSANQSPPSIAATCYVSINAESILFPSLSVTPISGRQQPHTSSATPSGWTWNKKSTPLKPECVLAVIIGLLLITACSYLSHFRGMSANIFHSLILNLHKSCC